MRPLHRHRFTRLGLEALEDRTLLSGNVLASIQNGTLNIVGDGGNNNIQIAYGATPATIVVSGTLTGVNGTGSVLFPASVINNIKIQMKDGNDTVNVAISVPGNLSITAGSGNDTITVGAGSSNPPINFGSLTIKAQSTSQTADTVTLQNVAVSGAASITTGNGNDTVAGGSIYNSFFGPNYYSTFGSLTINTGNGNSTTPINPYQIGDAVILANVAVSGATNITTGSGDDNISITGYADSYGNGGLSTFGSLAINTGTADPNLPTGPTGDTLLVQGVSVSGAASILTGSGNDTITVTGETATNTNTYPPITTIIPSTFGTLTIATGKGNETVDLQSLTPGKLNVKLGLGYNTVEAGNVTAGSGVVDGGPGTNVYQDDGGNSGYKVVDFKAYLP